MMGVGEEERIDLSEKRLQRRRGGGGFRRLRARHQLVRGRPALSGVAAPGPERGGSHQGRERATEKKRIGRYVVTCAMCHLCVA